MFSGTGSSGQLIGKYFMDYYQLSFYSFENK